jgi:hypothetical protein
MKSTLFIWILMGRLLLSLWQGLPPQEQEIVIKVCAEEYAMANPNCEVVQIAVVQLESDNDYIYFLANCLEVKGGYDVWQKKGSTIGGMQMWKN